MSDNSNLPLFAQHLLSHGSLKYIGAPCRDNPKHIGLRYVKHNSCVECTLANNEGIEPSVQYRWLADEMQIDIHKVPVGRFKHPVAKSDKRCDRTGAKKAKLAGKRFFYGSVCTNCGNNLRLAANRGCAGCEKVHGAVFSAGPDNLKIMQENRDAEALVEGRFVPVNSMKFDRHVRANADMLGRSTYIGAPCKHCGGTERYTQRGQCVKCVKTRNDTRSTKARKKKPAEAGSEFDHLFD